MRQHTIIAHISDLHIGASAKIRGEAPADNLRRALQTIARYAPDAILATGDLANDERPEEYRELAAVLSDAPAPLYLVPGNHDNPALVRAYFPGHDYLPSAAPLSYCIDSFPIRIVAVDQTASGEVGGIFTPAHAHWLDAALCAAPDTPTIVALHHPPFSTHDRLFDTIGLSGSDAFAEIISRHRQIARVVCGHHHRLTLGAVAHAPVVSAPSTAWIYGLAFKEADQAAPITQEPPGFLLHVWSDALGLATHLINF